MDKLIKKVTYEERRKKIRNKIKPNDGHSLWEAVKISNVWKIIPYQRRYNMREKPLTMMKILLKNLASTSMIKFRI